LILTAKIDTLPAMSNEQNLIAELTLNVICNTKKWYHISRSTMGMITIHSLLAEDWLD